jgi:hypothetical protein
MAALLLVAATAAAQDHPCENDNVRTSGGGENAYRKECCEQPVPGYYLCVVDFA